MSVEILFSFLLRSLGQRIVIQTPLHPLFELVVGIQPFRGDEDVALHRTFGEIHRPGALVRAVGTEYSNCDCFYSVPTAQKTDSRSLFYHYSKVHNLIILLF